MAIRHGRNVAIYVGGTDISGDLNDIQTTSVQELPDVTTFMGTGTTTIAHAFYPGLAKDTGTISAVYNDTEKAVFEALIQLQPAYGGMIVFGSTLGDPAYCVNEMMLKSNSVKAIVTDVNRASIGFDTDNWPFEPAATLSATSVAQAPAKQNVGPLATGTGTTVDNGSASGTTGGAAYLQVFNVNAPGALTIHVEQSSTGAFAGEQTTTCTFAAAATNTTQRIAITTQIYRYARAGWANTGSSSNYALALTRY